MNLEQALQQIALDAGLDAAALIRYAEEDRIGGRDTTYNRLPSDWPGMSTFSDEGRVIYALVRALRPQQVVEVGVDSGGTSTHILTALEANGTGKLWSVDINPESGTLVPEHLRHRWTFANDDALTVELPNHADFIFEDGEHTYDFTLNVLSRLKELNPRILMSHDYYTHETYQGFFVKQAFDEVLPEGKGIKLDGAFTGLGYWVNEDWQPAVQTIEHIEIQEVSFMPDGSTEIGGVYEPPKPTVKRKTTKRKAAK